MYSKSWPEMSTTQCRLSGKHLGCHTDPIVYTVEDWRRNKTLKSCDESLKRASKRSSSSSFEGYSHTFGPISSDDTDSFVSGFTTPPYSKGESSIDEPGTSTSAVISNRTETEGRKSLKRKLEETEEPSKRSRKTDLTETPSHQSASDSSPNDSCVSALTAPSRDAFEAKYEEIGQLAEGGYGSVFNGYCKADYTPVAIKHIPQDRVRRIAMLLDGEDRMVPVEVALLLKLKPEAAGTSAVVTLLDWYDLSDELILVLEKPSPCLDLIEYMLARTTPLPEHEAKVIAKQLVDALIEIQSRGVFHGDVKLDNILIETGSNVPRVRIIDLGCGTLMSDRLYTLGRGTYEYSTPEWFLEGRYRAEPTTVWQLGVVLFGILHKRLPFCDHTEIVSEIPDVSGHLSYDCQDFIRSCLNKQSQDRPTLETLKQHPWLI